MKTILKIAGAAMLAAVLMCASVDAVDHGTHRGYSYSSRRGGDWHHHDGYRGYGGWNWGFGWSFGWPWYGYYDYPYYYSPYYYDPPTYYSPTYYPPPVVYGTPAPVTTNSPAPTTNFGPAQPARRPPSAPSTSLLSPADVKALVNAGISDEVVISQIQQSRVVYRLNTQEIIDLKESGVSEKVIDFMINTASRR